MSDLVQILRAYIPGEQAHEKLVAERMAQAAEIERLRTQLAIVRNAGNQALRQWKMYADMTDGPEDFAKSAEGSVYEACKAHLTQEIV